MPVTIQRSGTILVDDKGAAKAVAQAALKRVVARLKSGVGADGNALPEYSPLVREQREAIGLSTKAGVSSTGALLDDLQVLDVTSTGGVTTITIGAGNGSSTNTPRPPPYVFSSRNTSAEKAKALARWRAAPKRVTQSPPHALLIEYLSEGGQGRPARALLGLSPEDQREILAELERFPLFKQG